MDVLTVFLFLSLIWLALWAGYSRMRRNQFITYAKRQEAHLMKFVRQAPFDIDARFPLKQGEMVVWELENASLAETRRGPRVTQRQMDAFTFRFAPGFYYTAAGGKSVSDAHDEMKDIDIGRATFTNKRVIFVGEKHTREWDFSKLLGWEVTPGGYIMMAVSNRQRMSGVSGSLNDLMASVAFDLSQIVASNGFDSAKVSAESGTRSAREQAKFAEQFLLYRPKEIERHREKVEEETRARLDELDRAGHQKWVEPGKPIPEESTPRADLENDTSSPSARLGAVPEELEVVGEFYHPQAFANLRARFGTEGGSEHIVEAELRNDPENPYSDSGKAVAVYIYGEHVGHVPEVLAPGIFELVEAKGGTVNLGARVWLDHEDSKPGKSSVQVFIDSRLTG